MAWSGVPLGSVASTTAASSYATGSYTPTANRLLVAFVQNSGPGADDTADDHPTFSGNGVTWSEVAQAIPASSPRVLTLFVALSGASPTTGAGTAAYGQNQAGACISVEEFEIEGGVPATALGAIAQSVAAAPATGGTSPTQDLVSAPAATSRCIAGWSTNRNEAMGVRTNWTEFHDIGFTTPDTHLETQWRSDAAEQTAGTSWATSSLYRVIVAEIAQTPAGGTDLVIQEATHAHSAESQSFTQVHNLTVEEASHGHAADQQALVQVHNLITADGLHAHSADNLVLEVEGDLGIAGATHGHTADSLALTQVHDLVVANAEHGHSADGLSLAQVHNLGIAEALQGHTADNVVLIAEGDLAIADALHAHVADILSLTQVHELVIQDASHGHLAEALALVIDLGIQDALHGHSVDGIILTQLHLLAIADALHGHSADNVVLSAFLPVARRTGTATPRRQTVGVSRRQTVATPRR